MFLTLLTSQLEISLLNREFANVKLISVTLRTFHLLMSPSNSVNENKLFMFVIAVVSIQLRLQLLPNCLEKLSIIFNSSLVSLTL